MQPLYLDQGAGEEREVISITKKIISHRAKAYSICILVMLFGVNNAALAMSATEAYKTISIEGMDIPKALQQDIQQLSLAGVLGIFPRKRTKTSGARVISGLSEGITFPELAYIHQLRASAPQDPVTFHSIRSYRYP